MKIPCKECIALAMCLQRYKYYNQDTGHGSKDSILFVAMDHRCKLYDILFLPDKEIPKSKEDLSRMRKNLDISTSFFLTGYNQ